MSNSRKVLGSSRSGAGHVLPEFAGFWHAYCWTADSKLTVGVNESVNGDCLYMLALRLVQGLPHFLPKRDRIGRDRHYT